MQGMRKMRHMRGDPPLSQPVPEPAYRVREIAVMLSVAESTVYRWIEKGALPAYRFEDSIRVAAEDFEAFKKRSAIRPARKLTSAKAVA
jgi:excisionase family DNA binding protein